jgi:O-antigen/teichoic acid export membrane protein
MNDAKRLVSNSLIVFVGTIFGSVFSYLFNTLMGRMLGPAQYGEMAAIMSLLMIVGVGGGAVLTIIMRYSGELYHIGQYQAIMKLLKTYTRYLFFLSIILFLVGLSLTRVIADFFTITHFIPIAIGLTSIIFSLLIVINKGILQGTQQFIPLSVLTAVEMLLRLLIGVLLVRIGFAVSGAILAIVLATAIAYIFTFLPLRKISEKAISQKDKKVFVFDKREMFSYSWPTFLATFLLATAMNVDVILVKHNFSPEIAGQYAAISTVAKIILYLTTPIISVMFPMISEKKIKGEKHYKTFLLSMIVTIVVALIILGVYNVMPRFIINLLYGHDYVSLYNLLPQIGFFIVFYTLVNLISNYFIAVKDFFFIIPFTVLLVGQILTIEYYHPTISAVVRVFVATTALLFGLLIVYYLYTKREQLLLMLKGQYGEES